MRKLLLPLLLLSLSIFSTHTINAQNNVGIGTTTPNTEAILDLDPSSPLGLLMPRLVLNDTNSFSPIAANDGMIFYATDINAFVYYDASTTFWTQVGSGAGGSAGADGLTSLITATPEAPGLNCTEGGQRIDIGLDDNDDAVLQGGEIDNTFYVCNGASGIDGLDGDRYATSSTTSLTIALGVQSLTVDTALAYTAAQTVIIAESGANFMEATVTAYNPTTGVLDVNVTTITGAGTFASWTVNLAGAPGPAGTDGLNSLSTTTAEPAGVNCTNGGQFIEVGLDDNADGALDPGEVDYSFYICDGDTGVAGTNGIDGLISLSTATAEPAGVNCNNGGQFVEVGLDDNADGTLDPGEVDYTYYICDGDTGVAGTNGIDGLNSLSTATAEPAGVNCTNGGQFIEVGLDDNADGALDPGEVDYTYFVCNGDTGTAGTDGLDGDRYATSSTTSLTIALGVQSLTVDTALAYTAAQTVIIAESGANFMEATVTAYNPTTGVLDVNVTTITGGGTFASWTVNLAGAPGPAGTNGLNSLSTATPEPAGVNCSNGGQFIEVGLDDNADGTLDPGEVDYSYFLCDGDTGVAGVNGVDGLNNLSAITAEPAGVNCTNGGQFIEVGLDDNADGTLDPGEVDFTYFVCNGDTGEAGIDGLDGDRYATNSTTSLNIGDGIQIFTVDTALAYTTGQTIIVAFDPSNSFEATINTYDPSTGIINATENNTTGGGTFANWSVNLAGAPGPAGTDGLNSLSTATPEPAGVNCSNGGQFIEVGLDDNADGALDPGEVDYSYYICTGDSGVNGNTVLNGIVDPTAPIGNDGDFYINTVTDSIFGPKAAGAWPPFGEPLVRPGGANDTIPANVFSARIDNNGTASILSQSYPFIQSVTRIALGEVEIIYNPGFFTVEPSITVVPTEDGGLDVTIDRTRTDATKVVVTLRASGGGANLDRDFNLICQRQGADYQNSLTAPPNVVGYWKGNGTDIYFDTAAVAIGAASVTPGYQLDVVGGDARINGLTIGLGNNGVASNTALGSNALSSNTAGANNVAIGINALSSNLGGNRNIAIGEGALTNNTSGNENVGIGAVSLSNNGTGIWNTAVGYVSMASATGSFNSAFGRGALENNTGSGNSGFGQNTLPSISGDANTALGADAGTTLTSGDFNTFVGQGANAGVANLNNATAIGAGAVVGASNSLVLGNGATSVGIGTQTPANKLEVIGDAAKFDSVIIVNNAQAGYVLTAADATGAASWQPASGGTAWDLLGNAGTVDGTNFIGTTDNIPINFRVNNITAGRISSTGATSYGFQSALNNTDVQTTAFGYRALGQNVGGTENTAFGYNALSQNTASSNAAFGTNALVSNVSGTQNVAMGSGALGTNFDGDNNTAIGERALQNNSDGSSNTAVGLTSLFANVSGNQNSALGWDALFSTTGSDNAALGYRAGFSNTTGSLNTFIGQNADAGSGGLTNATAIGAGAVVGANNSLILGSPNVRVGIGVAVPGYDLDIDKNAAAAEVNMQIRNNAPDGSTNIYISGDAAGYLVGTGGSSIGNGLEQKFFIGNTLTGGLPFIIDNNDRIGIGTAFPTANLSIVGDSAAGGFVFAEIENSNADGLASLDFVNDANRMEIRFEGSNIADNSLIIYDDDASLARFIIDDATGNVGIGDLTPQSELDITGSVAGDFVSAEIENLDATGSASLDIWTDTRAYILGVDGSSAGSATENDFYIYDAIAGTDRLVINEIGNVGIGTSSPANRLEVIGDAAKFDSVIIVNGAQVGYVLTAADATGTASWQPLGASTFWDLNGNAGTIDGTNFIGTTDGVPLNFRINNQPSGRIDGPGTSVTTLGYLAGNNGAGINNTAFGAGAMQSNTADGNSAFGSLSLLTNIAGNANTAVGYAALRNIDGVQNTAVGNAAMENSTSGADNVAVGYLSLLNNNASGNVAVGANSLENTDGQGNIGVGYAAGQNNVGGTFNIALGHNADVGAAGLSNAIAIGLNAVVDASNSMVIGGTGADAVNVGIGTSSPGQTLHVASEGLGGSNNMILEGHSISSSRGPGINIRRSKGTISAPSIVSNGDYLGGINFAGHGASNFQISAGMQAYADGTVAGTSVPARLAFSTTLDGASTSTERMTILNNGNVGIGTSTPQELLHLNGGTIRFEDFAGNGRQILTVNNTGIVGFTDLGDSVFWAANGNDIYNKNSGNVGIGTMSPTQSLHVAGAGATGMLVDAGGNTFLSLMTSNVAATANLNFRLSGTTVGRIRYAFNATPANEQLEFNVNGASRMILDGSGNAAIGNNTIAPVRLYNYIEPTNSTVTTGISNSNFYNGASSKFGTVNFVSADGTGEKIGSASIVNGNAGSAFSIFGSTNEVNHPGNGNTYGSRSIVNKPSAVSGFVYGDYIEMDNDGTNTGYMYYGSSIGSGGGIQYGAYMTGEDRNYFSNRVGIGTPAPSVDLHVSSTTVGVARFQSTTNPLVTFYSGATYLGYIQGINDDMIFGTAPASSGDVGLYAGGAQRVTVANTGFVGIGTTIPDQELEVQGTGQTEIHVDAGSNAFILLDAGLTSSQSTTIFQRAGATRGYLRYLHNATATSEQMNLAVNNSIVLTATGSGDVGIGTSIPSTKLEVFESSTAITPLMEIQNSGTGDAAMRFISGNTWSMGIDNSDLDKFKIADGTTVSSLTRFTMTTAGNVGLGTTAPVNRLDVEGSAAIGATYSGTNSAQANGLIVQENVGIGYNGASDLYQLRVDIPSTNSSTPYGAYINNDYSGGSTKYGLFTDVSIDGNGSKYGIWANSNGASGSSSLAMGARYFVNHAGTGTVYGTYVDANKASGQSGNLYASYAIADHDGTGTSYVYYGTSPGSTSGTEYGIYMTGEDINYFSNFVGIGTTAPSYELHVTTSLTNGQVAFFQNSSTGSNADGIAIQLAGTAGSNDYIYFERSGGLVQGRIAANGAGAVSYLTSSDRRLKKDINDFDGGLDMVLKMQPRNYVFKGSPDMARIGFIAQELDDIFPEAVSGDENGDFETDPMMVDYSKLTPVLTSSVQELHKMVMDQQNQIDELSAKVSSTEGNIEVDSESNSIVINKDEYLKQQEELKALKADVEELKKLLLNVKR